MLPLINLLGETFSNPQYGLHSLSGLIVGKNAFGLTANTGYHWFEDLATTVSGSDARDPSAESFDTVSDPFFGSFLVADATPLPATLPLFATGLGALGLLGWCRKRKAQVATRQNT